MSLALVAAVVLMLVMVEGVSLFVIPRISKIEGRTEREFRDAVAIRPGTGGTASVLLLGNSLLDAGVHFPDLAERLSRSGHATRRVIVENTAYTDWYYGIRRLASEGARPDAVVLMLSWDQLLSDSFRGSYSARRLVRFRDIPQAGADAGAGNTDLTGLLLSNLSAFYGLREELRKQVLSRLVPDLPGLTSRLVRPQVSVTAISDTEQLKIGAKRLTAMRLEVEAHGGRFVLALPPLLLPDAAAQRRRVDAAATQASVTVIEPVASGSLEKSHYSDGVHLNEQGAGILTPRLADAIRQALATPLKR